MGNKVLTISVAAYNIEKYINQTLESLIIPHNFNDLEVLIVNDGSNDSTALIANKYVQKYPNVFKLINKENAGYGSTINTSIKIAHGKYFKQLDGDDWFLTENLSEFIEFLKSSDADCIYSPYWKIHQHSGKRELKTAVNTNRNAIDMQDIGMWALTFKLNIFTENHITITENCFYTDTEYNLKPLFWIDSIEYFNNPIYCYRMERLGQSMSKESRKKHFKDSQRVALEMLSYYALNKETSVALTQNIIEKCILREYKGVFYHTLELSDKTSWEEYKKFDLTVKDQYPMFYGQKSLEMTILAKSGYRLLGISRIFHRVFKNRKILDSLRFNNSRNLK